MTFAVPADAYDRFMGRYSIQLSSQLADLAGIRRGQQVLDVGCGPGALTGELVRRLGADGVSAVDPSEPFVAATRTRHPAVDVQQATAEQLPFEDGMFDAALAQLVVHFMQDPVAGLREMARVTRPGGVVAACVWDHAGERTPLTTFWRAARDIDPGVHDEGDRAGAREGELAELFAEAGIGSLEASTLDVSLELADFDEWWEPFTFGVGPAGAYVKGLDDTGRERLRERCRELIGETPFTMSATAWAVRGLVR